MSELCLALPLILVSDFATFTEARSNGAWKKKAEAGKLSYRNGSRGLVPQYCLLLVLLFVISHSGLR